MPGTRFVGIRKKNSELFPAYTGALELIQVNPGPNINGAPDSRFYTIGNCLDNPVTSSMAIVIIVLLEKIDIDDDQGEFAFFSLDTGTFCLEPEIE